jgi:glycosyltransferase involved in cell wall biosynthesis
MAQPEASIIVPMRNAGPFVREALLSILAQADISLEIIVVDDGSEDNSAQQVRAIGDDRIRLIPGPHRGVAAAFNAALEQASGEFLGRCDADDLYVPGRLAWQTAWLRNHLEFGGVCGGFSTITSKGAWICDLDTGHVGAEITSELHETETRTSFCTWLVRTEVCRRVGGCREYFRLAEDIDLQLRISESARIWYQPIRTYLYRLHDASATHSANAARREFYDDTARLFAQQRRERGTDDLQRGAPPQPPVGGISRPMGSREHTQELLMGMAWNQFSAGSRRRALVTGLRGCLARPLCFGAWRSLGALALRVHRT